MLQSPTDIRTSHADATLVGSVAGGLPADLLAALDAAMRLHLGL